MKNYKLTIEYDGTAYFGWEHQPDKPTIQGKIEIVLARMLKGGAQIPGGAQMSGGAGEEIRPEDIPEVIGAGRTDAGVHARGMVANVVMETDLSCDEIRDYMNRYLPDDIGVLEVREAAERFHARYKASGKTYRYTVCNDVIHPVFNRKYYAVVDESLDLDAMKRAAEYMTGEHDYKSFCGNTHFKKSTVREVDSIDIKRSGSFVYLTFHGNGFLQNMVRIMTGTLLEVGKGRIKAEDIPEIIEAKDRSIAGPTAPAKGLCLMKVDY